MRARLDNIFLISKTAQQIKLAVTELKKKKKPKKWSVEELQTSLSSKHRAAAESFRE